MKSPVIGFIFEVEEESNHLFEGVNKENFLENFGYDFGCIKTKKGLVFDFLQHTVFLGDLTVCREKREIFVQQYLLNTEYLIDEIGQKELDKLWDEITIKDMEDDTIEDLYLDIYKEDTDESVKLKVKMAYISDEREGKEIVFKDISKINFL